MKPGIYLIVNVLSGKTYVGQSITVKSRMLGHFALLRRGVHSNPHLQSAFNLDGEDCFFPCVAEFCEQATLTEREAYWMEQLGRHRLYNLAPAGGSNVGMRMSEDTKKKIAATKIGKKRPPHVGMAVSLANKGRIFTKDQRENMSRARKGRIGTKHAESTKNRLSDIKSIKLTAFGLTKKLREWAEILKVDRSAIAYRLKCGWSVEDAVTLPARSVRHKKQTAEAFGASLGVQFSANPREVGR